MGGWGRVRGNKKKEGGGEREGEGGCRSRRGERVFLEARVVGVGYVLILKAGV